MQNTNEVKHEGKTAVNKPKVNPSKNPLLNQKTKFGNTKVGVNRGQGNIRKGQNR